MPVSRNFFNSFLTTHFVQLLSGHLSVNLFAVYPFKCKLFIRILSSSLNAMLIVDKRCSDICCSEFSVPQTDHKSKQVKEQWHGKFYLLSVWGKTRYFKHWKYQNWWRNNKVTSDLKMHFLRFIWRLQKTWIFISQGSVATCLRWGR